MVEYMFGPPPPARNKQNRSNHTTRPANLTPRPASDSPSLPAPHISPFAVPVPHISLSPEANTVALKTGHRPSTPLDFLRNTLPALPSISPDEMVLPTSNHRRMRSSMDSERPKLNPARRDLSHTFSDDLAIPTSPPRTTSFLLPSTPNKRLETFRESTRVKLVSFSGFLKGEEREKSTSEIAPGSGVGSTPLSTQEENRGRLHKSHLWTLPPLPARSSSLATQPVLFPEPPEHPEQPQQNMQAPPAPLSTVSVHDRSRTESTETSTAEDFTHLFTPSATSPGFPTYEASLTSTQSSNSHRDRVLGKRNGAVAAGPRVFVQPKLSDVVPFADDSPFSAWEAPAPAKASGPSLNRLGRKASMSQSRHSEATGTSSWAAFNASEPEDNSEDSKGGWVKLPQPRGAVGAKRVWQNGDGEVVGEVVGGVYKVGWERDVLDLGVRLVGITDMCREARLHETMWDVAGESHTFSRFSDDEPPKTVLDVGTGIGLWPISQALEWQNTTFVGLDLVPCQTDLGVLANAERTARTTSEGTARGTGIWESVEKRVTWDRANFLEPLPYDTGVFDMVHMRFIGLGVPESKWNDLIEECARVLKKGGILEIVETSYNLPPSSPTSLKNSFASLLLSDMIQPLPLLPLRFILPATASLVPATTRPVFEQIWSKNAPGALKEHLMYWVKSALEYKGTGLSKGKLRNDLAERATKGLHAANATKWNSGTSEEEGEDSTITENEATIWAWVLTRK